MSNTISPIKTQNLLQQLNKKVTPEEHPAHIKEINELARAILNYRRPVMDPGHLLAIGLIQEIDSPENSQVRAMTSCIRLKERLVKQIPTKDLYVLLSTNHSLIIRESTNLIPLFRFSLRKEDTDAIKNLFVTRDIKKTPLHLAVENCSEEDVMKLLKIWPEQTLAELFVPHDEHTPFDLALSLNRPYSMALLEKCPNPEMLFQKNTWELLSQLHSFSTLYPNTEERLIQVIKNLKNSRLEIKIASFLKTNPVFPQLKEHLKTTFATHLKIYISDLFDTIFLLPPLLNDEISEETRALLIEEINERRTSRDLSVQQLNTVLPHLLPEDIQKCIENLTEELSQEALEEVIFHDHSVFLLPDIFIALQEQLTLLDNPDLQAVAIQDIDQILKSIPPLSLSLYTQQHREEVIPFIPFMQEQQLAACLPFIPAEQMLLLSENLQRSPTLIKKAPLDVKKELFKKLLPSLESFFVNLLKKPNPTQIASLPVKTLELKQIQKAFLIGSNDRDLSKQVNKHKTKMDDIIEKLTAMNVQQTPDLDPEHFLDFFTRERMTHPLKIPRSDKHVDQSTIEHLQKNENGLIISPLDRQPDPIEAYLLDVELQQQLIHSSANEEGTTAP